MSLDILGASLAVPAPTSGSHLTVHTQRGTPSILGSFLFEESDEENENGGTENDHNARVSVKDFSRLAGSLNAIQLSHLNSSVRAFRNYVRPPLYELNCVFLI